MCAGETRDRAADVLSALVEKFTDLEDTLDRRLRDINDRLDGEVFETPSGSGSRPRNSGNSTPQRPDKVKKRSRCPFCGRAECADPVKCGLKLRWGTRMSIYKNKKLCPDRTCFKSHVGPCHKKEKVKCSHCSRGHASIWCVYLAQEEGLF